MLNLSVWCHSYDITKLTGCDKILIYYFKPCRYPLWYNINTLFYISLIQYTVILLYRHHSSKQCLCVLHWCMCFSLFLFSGFHNNNIRVIPERAFVGNPLLQTMWVSSHHHDLPAVELTTLCISNKSIVKMSRSTAELVHISKSSSWNSPLSHFYENPIQFVGRSAFQFLPQLHTL